MVFLLINPHIKAVYDYYFNLCSNSVKSEIDFFNTIINEKMSKHIYNSELKIFDKKIAQENFSVSLSGSYQTIEFELKDTTKSGYQLFFSIGYDLFDKNYIISLELKNFDNAFFNKYQYAYADNATPKENLTLVGTSGFGDISVCEDNFFYDTILIEKIFENYFNLQNIEDLLLLQFDYSYDIKNNEIINSLKKISNDSQQTIKNKIK